MEIFELTRAVGLAEQLHHGGPACGGELDPLGLRDDALHVRGQRGLKGEGLTIGVLEAQRPGMQALAGKGGLRADEGGGGERRVRL